MNTKNITTGRLLLRPIQVSDVPTIIDLLTNEQTRHHLGGPVEEEKAKQKALSYIDKSGYFCITNITDGIVIGICSLDKYRTGDIEVSYELFPEFWGYGYGKEAVTSILQWGFKNMDINHIIAVTQKSNTRSRKLLEAIGMKAVDEFTEFNEQQVKYVTNKKISKQKE